MLNYEIISDNKLVAKEVTDISKRLYEEVTNEIISVKHILEDIANNLLEHETLYEVDVDKILLNYEETRHLVDIEKHNLKLNNDTSKLDETINVKKEEIE